jgi:hypothetical protein
VLWVAYGFRNFVDAPKNCSSITVNFLSRLCLKIHYFEIKNFEKRNYHEKRAAHWYSVITLLLKPLKQRLIDISAFRTSKSLYSPYKSDNNIRSVFLFNRRDSRINETKFPTHVRFLFSIFYLSSHFNYRYIRDRCSDGSITQHTVSRVLCN